MRTTISRRTALGGLASAVALLRSGRAKAAETLRVGKAVVENIGFLPVDIGVEAGLFAREGLETRSTGWMWTRTRLRTS